MTVPPAGAPEPREARRARRRLIAEAKQSLRELRIELAILNHRVGSRSEVKDVDLDCLDVITRHGPISPTALARRIGVHLATMTGILDRLERGGWIVRARDQSDRRAVMVRGVPGKQRDIIELYDGMNSSLD
jgi:DNA-binding MarR family transcriptional regulator